MTSVYADGRVAGRQAEWLIWILPIIAVLSALAVPFMAIVLDSYDYPHGWLSAHFATIARSYLEHGVFELGGVPIQNNPPLTDLPDAYLNWPPLYPLLLSVVFFVFGDSEITHHLFAATINLSLGAVIALIVHRRFGLTAASIAAIAFFNAPILALYGHVGSQLHLALALCLLSLWLFGRARSDATTIVSARRRYAVAGCAVFTLSVLASWEPVLAAPGLAVAAILQRDWAGLRLAVAYGVGGFVAVCAVFGLYWSEYDYFGDAIIQRIMLRAGLDVAYDPAIAEIFQSPHFILESHEPPGSVGSDYLTKITWEALMEQGILGFVGLLFVVQAPIWRRGGTMTAYAVSGLLAIYVAWAILMSRHLADHHYQFLLLAPLAAICAGAVAGGIISRWSTRLSLQLSPLLVLVLIGSVAVVSVGGRMAVSAGLIHNHQPDSSVEIQFAEHLKSITEPGSIIAHAAPSMVPVYYSERHVIRSVWDEATWRKHRTGIAALCGDCPIYLAIPDGFRKEFAQLIATEQPISDTAHGVVFKIR